MSPVQVRVLVEEGRARVEITSRNNNTPLDVAHMVGATAVVEYLEGKVRHAWWTGLGGGVQVGCRGDVALHIGGNDGYVCVGFAECD